jgi:2,6-dihydroxypseudooxynicotine hydrolase
MTDTLLETAVANWGPRFTANGVDASDYQRITAPLTDWSQWCAAWSAGAKDYLSLADAALGHGQHRSASEHLARAATYFHFGKFLFVHAPEEARTACDAATDALTRALAYFDPPAKRITIPFGGAALAGVFRTPLGRGPFPTVWLIPGLDSTKEELREVERSFLERGMATFACDGPGQGEVEWQLPIQPDWSSVGEAVLRALRTIDEVDDDRMGVWGVSMGGYYATRVAAAGLPIRATVALSGPYDFGASFGNLNPLTQRAFQVRSRSASLDEAAVRARDFTVEHVARDIREPILIIMGAKDRLFPASDGQRLADETSSKAELITLANGNHGCANVINHHRPYAADWMASQLSTPND